MKRTAGIIALVFALAASLAAFGCAGETGSADNAITVSATTQAQIVPDRAAFTVTVSGTGDTPEAATAAANDAAGNLMAHLKTIGVAEDKMTAKDAEVVERYGEAMVVQEPFGGYEDEWGNWIEEGVDEYFYDASGDVVGYNATMKVRVSDFDAGALGQVAREARGAGAVEFSNLSFTVGNREQAYEQALSEAVDLAHAKAESLAKASGVYVGRLVNLAENSSADFEGTVKDESGSLKADDENTYDVEPTKIPVEASVTVSYAIS